MNKDVLVSGGPDPDFGTDGLANLPASMGYAGNLTWAPGTSPLVAGSSSTEEGKFLVTRLLNNGTADPSFGKNGVIQDQVMAQQRSVAIGAFEVEQDKTLIVVTTTTLSGSIIPCATRYSRDGILDPDYGQGGILQLSYPDTLSNDRLPDNEPLPDVQGQLYSLPSPMRTGLTPSGKLIVGWWYSVEKRTVIYRIDDTGQLDTSFNEVGYVHYPEALGSSSLGALLVLASGKVLAVGEHRSESGDFYPFLVRYTDTGALDVGFGNGGSGFVELPLQNYAGFRVNGCIETTEGNLIICGRGAGDNAALIGLDEDGRIDESFNPDPVPDLFQWLSAAYDGDKLVAAGHTSNPRYLIVARYNTDGSLDRAFGTDSGWVRLDYPGIPESSTPYDVKAVEERILVAGGSFVTRILA